MSTANNDRRQRIRDQMKEFYGDPNASGSSAHRKAQDGMRRTPGVAPEMDLDSEFFNVLKYTTDLLRRESLKGLVESDTELLRSVRKLDGELQELVYRNYAKFISATDTIREMRDNVAQMDTKLQALSSNVASIDEVSKGISDKLQEHHGRIESTITTNRMLKKIQFLVELPATMRRMLDRQEYGVCVKYWVAGDGFLTKHATIPSIAKIQTECRALAKGLYDKIEAAMCAVSLDDPEAMDGVRSHVENLRLLRATSLYTAAEQQQDEDSTTFEETILKTLMKGVSENFASGVAAAQRAMKAALVVPANLSTTELAKREAVIGKVGLREALAQLKSSCALLAVNSERVYSLLNKLDGSKVAMRVAQEVQPVLIDLLPPITKEMGQLACAVLCSIADEGRLALETPEAVSSAAQAAVNALLKQLKHTSMTLKTQGANYLDTALSSQSRAYAAMVDQALSDVLLRVAQALRAKAWQQPDPAAVRAMTGSYVAGANSTAALATAAQDEDKAPEEHTQRTAFAASRWVYAAVAAKLAEECTVQLVQGEALAADRAAAALRQLSEAAQLLLHRGIVLVGQLETAAVAEVGFHNAVGAVDPTLPPAQGGGVHPALVSLVWREWPKLTALLVALPPALPRDATTPSWFFAAGSGGAGGGGGGVKGSTLGPGAAASYTGRVFTTSSTGRSSGPGSTAGGTGKGGRPTVNYTRREDVVLQTSVDRIFSAGGAALLHTEPRDGRPATVMGCVVLYLLKGIVTHVRAATCARGYETFAFQRAQVHAAYLLRALLGPHKGTAPRQWLKAWDDATQRTVQQQLDEACCCAYERYEAKVPLSHAALEKIVEEAMAGAAGGGAVGRSTVATLPAVIAEGPSSNNSASAAVVPAPEPVATSRPPALSPPSKPIDSAPAPAAVAPPTTQSQVKAPAPAVVAPSALPAALATARPPSISHAQSDGFRRMDDDEMLPM